MGVSLDWNRRGGENSKMRVMIYSSRVFRSGTRYRNASVSSSSSSSSVDGLRIIERKPCTEYRVVLRSCRRLIAARYEDSVQRMWGRRSRRCDTEVAWRVMLGWFVVCCT